MANTEVSLFPISSVPPPLATHHSAPSLHFELHRIERSLKEMDRTWVGSDHQFSVGPLGIFVSADQKFQGEPLEHGVVGGVKFVIGK